METIYIKRFIKTEADLPQSERAKYFVGVKDNLNPEDIYEWFNYKNPVMADNQAEYWVNTFGYWLQPITLAELIKEKLPSEKQITFNAGAAISEKFPVFTETDAERLHNVRFSFGLGFELGAEYVINKLTE